MSAVSFSRTADIFDVRFWHKVDFSNGIGDRQTAKATVEDY
jgi:hypothetical protein